MEQRRWGNIIWSYQFWNGSWWITCVFWRFWGCTHLCLSMVSIWVRLSTGFQAKKDQGDHRSNEGNTQRINEKRYTGLTSLTTKVRRAGKESVSTFEARQSEGLRGVCFYNGAEWCGDEERVEVIKTQKRVSAVWMWWESWCVRDSKLDWNR